MGSFFLLILIIFFAIIGLIGAFVLRFVRLFTKQTSGFDTNKSTQNHRYNNQQNQRSHNESNHQKVFSKEEGEYIDYEEVK